jgi:N4-gp56 family major capsid protein
MALSFIPEIWSSKILVGLQKALVYGQPGVVNRDYEGDIAMQGDTVRIKSLSNPTIATYTKNSTTITPETLTDAQRALYIDQAKYFAFEVDDIDQAQGTGGDLETALQAATYGLRDAADQYIVGLYTGADSANQIGTVSVTTAALAYTQLRKLSVKLDEANVPQEGRWVVVPPWYHGLLLEEDKFVRVDASGSDQGLRNGIIGRALGFDVLKSNNAPLVTGDDYAVMAGHPMAISFAEQIVKVETYRPENAFSDAVKGLHVYGAKLVRPSAIATVVASIT